jgi:hypothetical protein
LESQWKGEEGGGANSHEEDKVRGEKRCVANNAEMPTPARSMTVK